jgi:hypothetical protein
VVNDAVVAVTDRDGAHAHVYRAVSNGLADKVSAVLRVPYDPHLGAGLTISPNDLRPGTRSAYSSLITGLSATDAARRRPAR